ncbi:uncharacterized protein LOC109706087, partial [Ananas comosus]|uniref:Uncharacterized protein LOC109706087 n=1 Tax=Ananas comosus TaxID=4615 RepID=A0A6P5EGN4_ANACO
MKDLSDHINTLEERLQHLNTDHEARITGLAQQVAAAREEGKSQHEEMLRMFAALQSQLHSVQIPRVSPPEGRSQEHARPGSSNTPIHVRDNKGKGILPTPLPMHDLEEEELVQHWPARHAVPQQQFIPYPKLDFPQFSGEDPQGWLESCRQYFDLYQIPRQQWLGVATMHIFGKARVWKQGYFINRPGVTWEEFTDAVCKRFADVGERYAIREFSNHKQTGSIESYQEKFEELRSQLLHYNPRLEEEFFIASYINGLKEELVPFMDISHPATLEDAYSHAKLHDRALTTMQRKSRIISKGAGGGHQSFNAYKPKEYGRAQAQGSTGGTSQQAQEHRRLIEQRRAAGQCFKCGDKYHPGHQCKNKTLFSLAAEDNVLEVYDEDCLREEEDVAGEEEGNNPDSEEKEEVGLSFNALSGENSPQTLQIQGEVGSKKLKILVDTGSTHSFLDFRVAKEVKARIESAAPLTVTVANGHKIMSKLRSPGFTWNMNDRSYKADLRIIRLEGSSVILGIDWLKTYGKVTFDYNNHTVSLDKDGQQLVLKGLAVGTGLKMLTAKEWKRDCQEGICCAIAKIAQIGECEEQVIPESIKEILQQFEDVFEEPKGLPPTRRQDHRIPLQGASQPVNIRPYRYTYEQKNEIERQVKEMLESGIIQPSTSPFASPVLLVKKKDNTWRFCVDYRQLNKLTVKDKYPIPLIDDLLDELGGSAYFSKIDLRAGYHQIRMDPEDVSKTAFRTHAGHYEFLVMPFGLTNAPATFQSIMNEVFADYLRRYVLVFFDDILVYSRNIEDHKAHLSVVLRTLRGQQLYAKRSKCYFGQQRVEYLGYIVTPEGVATDPKKVEAMVTWPTPTSLKGLRGFLGITGYYRRFIKNYRRLSKPLTELFRKDQFKWSSETQTAFENLKEIMTQAPVLAMPDYTRPFVVEVDACGQRIGAVLSQEGRPIAYISKAITQRNIGLSTYEKEFLAILLTVNKWKHYLSPRQFVIKTDHQSLKHLLEQKITTAVQQKGMVKLTKLDYIIHYKAGKKNRSADSLSRRGFEEGTSAAITTVIPSWVAELAASYRGDEKCQQLISKLLLQPDPQSKYTYSQEMLRYKGRIYVGDQGGVQGKIIHELHSSALGAHSGARHTYKRAKQYFYLPGLKQNVEEYTKGCAVCIQNK